jgi:hypothetical protein
MRAKTVTMVSVCAILVGAVTIGLHAQSRKGPSPSRGRPRPAAKAKECRPAQPTRIQIDLFDLACPTEQLVKLDLDQIGADQASASEILDRLGKLGDVKHLIRVDNIVDLTNESSINQGVRIPVVKDMTVSGSGQVTPSVSYENVGFIAEFTGQWRDGTARSRADVTCSIEVSGIQESGVQITSGVNLPTYNQMRIRQKMNLVGSVPVLILCNDVPITKDDKWRTHVTVVRLVMTKLPD